MEREEKAVWKRERRCEENTYTTIDVASLGRDERRESKKRRVNTGKEREEGLMRPRKS